MNALHHALRDSINSYRPHRISTSPKTSTCFVIENPIFWNRLILGVFDSDMRVSRDDG